MKAPAPATAEAVPLELNDFPDWLPPMLVKELRQGLRTRAFVLSLTALHVAMVLILANGLAQSVDGANSGSVGVLFGGVIYLILLAGTSLRALNGLHQERSMRTLELLSAAGVSGTRLALGKWVALMAQGALLIVSVVAVSLKNYYLGGVDLLLEAKLLFLTGLASSVCAALGVAVSVSNVLLRGIAATGIGLGTLIFWGAMTALQDSPEGLAELNRMSLEWFGFLGLAGLAVTVLLRLAGDALDTPARNGALFPRILLVTGWAAAVFPAFDRLATVYQLTHLCILGALTCIAFFWHLHGDLPLWTVQLRPFARLGAVGRLPALLFSPNWVGALWLPPVALFALMATHPHWELQPLLWLLGANLLSAVWIWRLFFKKYSDPKGCFLLYWACGGLLAALAYALGARWNLPWSSLLPPLGLWQYVDAPLKATYAAEWTEAARSSCFIHLLLCLFPALWWIRASSAWQNVFSGTKPDTSTA